ncbi:1D-myo-inositol 2-acetamido-2-deoxy-alpha-D-glucopyranoside deacetylase [Microtetraspora sp. NBRC 13810]|nr:1D-myo-inositol 2-acetamido-2-deoxy-alpha-D-glucopyranoside deacetylase [Microtetraspora sp. NBRC 13810]
MARYAAEGAHVALVTCTLGEEGEVIPEELAHLAADREGTLGEHRVGELAAACAALGVTDHRFLGGPGRFRDSGMMGVASNHHPRAFWQADVDEAAAELVRVIREVRPHVLVTYDENGFYGHPDHIQAHRVSWRAFRLAADAGFGSGEPWRIAKFYHTATPRSVLARSADALREARNAPFVPQDVADLPFGCKDQDVTTEIDARAHLAAKAAAMRAHATQISVAPPWYALSNGIGQEILGVEHFILRAGVPGAPGAGAPFEAGGLGEPHAREDDLFGGVH